MIGDRIKEIRVRCGLNQFDFGKRLSLSQSAVANYEKNVRIPIDAVIASICREFSVSEKWLRTGEGEPFIEKDRDKQIEEMVDEIMRQKPEDFRRRFVRALAALDADGWKAIENFIDAINAERAQASQESKPAPSATTDLTPEEQEIIRQHREKHAGLAESTA